MPSMKNSLLLIALSVLVGCASRPQVAYKPVQVPPLPPEVGTKREVNLTERLSQQLLKSSPKETETQPSSTPASTPTTPSGSK